MLLRLLGVAAIALPAAAAYDFKSLSSDLALSALNVLKAGPLPATNAKHAASIKDMHFAIKLLSSLNVSGYAAQCTAHCDALANAFKQSTSSLQLYFAHSASEGCGCKSIVFGSKADIIMDEDLERDDLHSLCGAALALKASNKSDSIKDVLTKIAALMKSDGTFKNSPTISTSSTANTRLAISVLAEYASQWPKASLSEILDTVLQLLPEGDDDIAVETSLFAKLMKVSEKKSSITPSRLQLIMENLHNVVYSSDISIAADAVESLITVTTFKTQPVLFHLQKTDFKASDSVLLALQAVNAIGDAIVIESASVKSVKKVGKDSNYFDDVMAVTSDGAVADLSSVKLSSSVYAVELSVVISGRAKAIVHEDLFTVYGAYQISNVMFAIGTNKKSVSSAAYPLGSQLSLSGASASSSNSEVVYVAFTVSAPQADNAKFSKPHQAFLRLSSPSRESYSVVAAWDGKLVDGVGGKYYSTVSLVEESVRFRYESGDYSLSILVADFSAEAIEWNLGSVRLDMPAPPTKHAPLYVKSLLDASDNTLVAMPEISHKMRPPATRASAILSVLFTLLSLAPLAVLLWFVNSLNVNIKKLTSIANILFVACVVALLVIYVGYWLGVKGLSFYDTIKWLFLAVPLTTIIGRSALSNLSSE